MKLLAVSADAASTIATIRLARPLGALVEQRPGWSLRRRSLHACAAADLEWADVLILQRGLTRRAWRLVEAMRRSGGRVVYEIDDLLTRMPPNLVHHAAVERGQPWLRRCLAAADIVSVSTARLARELAELAPTRWVEVPNYGGAVAPAAAAAPRIEDPPALLFASSDRVPVSAVAQALRGLRAAGVALGAVIAIGPVAADLAAAGISVDALPGLPYLEFLRYLRRLGPTLALIPVGATPFDACKSAIKFYDYALAGIPVICADRPPYSDVIEAGVDGWLVADEPEAWRAAIAQAAADPRRRARVSAAAASRVAADHGLDRTVAAWAGLLEALGPRRAPARRAAAAPGRWVGAMLAWLRRINRARLARRSARDRR